MPGSAARMTGMAIDAVRTYTAGEVPALRRDLAEYYGYRYQGVKFGHSRAVRTS